MPKMYGWVREVVPESPADRAGLQPGDLLRTINGHLVRDLVDFRFYIADEELTPLYVSVHTTDPDLRRKMVDGPRAGDIIEHIKRLGSMHITCHTQLVLCPPINDGPHLDRSIRDLAELRPIVESISVVPVGLTKYNNMMKTGDLPPLRHYTREEAEVVIDQIEEHQRHFEAEDPDDYPFVYLSDEWYYLTERTFPAA